MGGKNEKLAARALPYMPQWGIAPLG